ncbi:Terminase-like family [uncultured Caudovirales phage]|uniref:Terminase-like family n=1 Tax=uncultured Caudovirales phage TaxID=2100421 RepID=A0A6J5NLR3_9CAUD|nr:Terminase-like family [uncultured Caudovirales phage]
MPLSLRQQQIANCTARFRVVVAGRRSGKTFLAMRELARFARIPNRTVWYITGSRQQAKSLVWDRLKTRLRNLRWIQDTNESELTIRLVNGSRICLKSAEQGDTLRGESLDFVVVDEFCDLDLDETWSQILRPALADQLGHALFLGTPKAANQAAKDLFDTASQRANWASFTYTTAEGGFVHADEIAQAQLDLAPRVFKQEYLASWETFAGVIFNEFGDHNIQTVAPPSARETVLVGMDFNTSPMSAVLARRTSTQLQVFDEIFIENSTTTEMIEEIRRRYPANPIECFPDPAGVQRKTSAGGNTDIRLLEQAQFRCRYHRQHPLVRDRINSGNSLFFLRPGGSVRFAIDPQCKRTVRSLRNWSYKPETMIPDKDTGWDHACDALTYMIHYLYPIGEQPKTVPQQRFGFGISA